MLLRIATAPTLEPPYNSTSQARAMDSVAAPSSMMDGTTTITTENDFGEKSMGNGSRHSDTHVKTPSSTHPGTPLEAPLTLIDQMMPPAYTRMILCFSLPSSTDPAGIIRILRQGLKATVSDIPILSGEVKWAGSSKQKGLCAIHLGCHPELVVKDLTASHLGFSDLRANNFPPSELNGDILCAHPGFPQQRIDLPILAIQASFIEGGMLLGLCIHHLALDGVGITTFLKVLAENCRVFQGQRGEAASKVQIPAALFDRTPLMQGSGNGLISDHPEYTILPRSLTGPPAFLLKSTQSAIFYFSRPALTALKSAASPANCSYSPPSEVRWVSTNDAISALVWRSVMAASYAANRISADAPTSFSLAINGRQRCDPPLPQDWLGNAILYSRADRQLTALFAPNNLADLAVQVRKSVAKVDSAHIKDVVQLLSSLPDISLIKPSCLSDVLGTDAFLTSWWSMSLYQIDWESAFGGRCESVRVPDKGLLPGLQIVLPEVEESKGGGCEIMIVLEEEVMERLREDEVWMKYAEAR